MEIFEICARLENMLHHVVGLGTYRAYINAAIKELKIYQQRLEYEDSCGYRNELDLVKDHAKDLEDENAILKEANERFHTELRLATRYVRETRTKLRRAHSNLWHSEDDVATLIEKLRKKELEVEQLSQVIQSKAYAEVTVTRFREVNNPQNFCGNCKYCKYMNGQAYCQHPRVCIWSIDPDDASCPAFQSNQVDRVIVGKPEFPCCNGCDHEDCDDCTLCPF